jgi:uncharacterized membrane protein YkoI
VKRSTQLLAALGLVAALGSGAVLATGTGSYPSEVNFSSIKLPRGVESRSEFAQHAKVTQQEAEAAALAALPGKVIKAKLDDEDGYLVWKIDVKHDKGVTEVAVDAGNAKVLAAEAEDDDEHEDRD